MDTAGLEVKPVLGKAFIMEAIVYCLKKWILVNVFSSCRLEKF